MSMTRFIDLSEDVLFYITRYLVIGDIVNLALTCKLLYPLLDSNSVFRHLYVRYFGSKPRPLSLDNYNWKELFKLRISKSALLYTWGSSLYGRLGYLLGNIPISHVSRNLLVKNVHTPTNISNFNGHIISDINAGGFSFQVLLSDGSLYHTGVRWKASERVMLTPGPISTADYIPPALNSLTLVPFVSNLGARHHILRTRINQANNRGGNHNSLIPNDNGTSLASGQDQTAISRDRLEETNFITKLRSPLTGKITAISSGRQHIVALDEDNNLLSWDTGCNSTTGVKLVFPGLKSNVISKILAGWNCTLCYFEKVGIVVQYSREPISKEQYDNKTIESEAHYFLIPDSTNVVDFMAGSDYVLCIKEDGRLYRNDFNLHSDAVDGISRTYCESPEPVSKFNTWLDSHNAESGNMSSFSKLEGNYNSYVVYTNDGLVLLGQKDSSTPQILPGLQNKDIINLAIGDYHFLALTSSGDLLSWGIESNQCGCLGVGESVHQTETTNNSRDIAISSRPRQLELRDPTLVTRPSTSGKWLATAAAGWHSCGIYVSL